MQNLINILTQIGGDATTSAMFEPGEIANYPNTGVMLVYAKHDPDSAVTAVKGSCVGKLAESSLTAGGNFFNPTVKAGKVYTADLSRSSSIYGVAIALNNFSSSASSLRYGWFMVKGELLDLNRMLAKQGISSIQARGSSIGANGILVFDEDGKFGTVAATTIRAALNGMGRARVASSGSAISNLVLWGRNI